jgi:hypothetical protein
MHWPRPTQGSEPSPNSPHYTSCSLQVRKFCQENSESRNTSRGCEASWCSGGACCSLASRHTRVGMCPVYSAGSASCAIHGMILEIHTALPAHYFERRCSGQFSPIGNDVDSRRQSRTTDSFDASDTHAYWLSTIREQALSAEHSTEFSRRFGIVQVTKLSVLPRLELFRQSEPLASSRTKGRTEMRRGGLRRRRVVFWCGRAANHRSQLHSARALERRPRTRHRDFSTIHLDSSK